MQITLSSKQSQILESLSQQGGYSSLTDAIDTALLLLADEVSQNGTTEKTDYLEWVEQTRLKVEEGIKAAEQGDVLDADVMLTRLRQKVEAARGSSA